MAYTTIKKPSDYFNTKLYTGNSSTNAITGVGFQPDWVWLKDRNSTEFHNVFDIVRGVTANRLYPNSTTATDGYDSNALQSFDSDGFTLGSGLAYNNSGNNFVSWNWLGSNTTASNTDGSISSTVSANTTSGFSIVKWTGNGTSGATVGHGLGSAPKVVISKRIDGGTNQWVVGHGAIGFTKVIYLNNTTVAASNSGSWNNTAPSSTVFTVGNNNESNGTGYEFISYCFAEKTGYSKFGSYTGNGNADGTFVYTGFKPAFVIYKNTDTGYYWKLIDNKTNNGNGNEGAYTHPNTTDYVNSSSLYDDFYSNGFKLRNTNVTGNGSGLNYIYMAFAEEPLVGDNPATAR